MDRQPVAIELQFGDGARIAGWLVLQESKRRLDAIGHRIQKQVRLCGIAFSANGAFERPFIGKKGFAAGTVDHVWITSAISKEEVVEAVHDGIVLSSPYRVHCFSVMTSNCPAFCGAFVIPHRFV
jgi:hypothetical protein